MQYRTASCCVTAIEPIANLINRPDLTSLLICICYEDVKTFRDE